MVEFGLNIDEFASIEKDSKESKSSSNTGVLPRCTVESA